MLRSKLAIIRTMLAALHTAVRPPHNRQAAVLTAKPRWLCGSMISWQRGCQGLCREWPRQCCPLPIAGRRQRCCQHMSGSFFSDSAHVAIMSTSARPSAGSDQQQAFVGKARNNCVALRPRAVCMVCAAVRPHVTTTARDCGCRCRGSCYLCQLRRTASSLEM